MRTRQRYWTVLRTKQASSADARKYVVQQGFEIYHPLYRTRPEFGVRRILPLFPHYLLVRINVRRQQWQKLRHTRGVAMMFMSGDVPSQVGDEHVAHFRALENEMGYYEMPEHEAPRFTPWEPVIGLGGLFEGCEGVYQGIAGNSHERVRVLFHILGQPKVVEMKAYDLASAIAA
jgi:transcription antitermination factor NusG